MEEAQGVTADDGTYAPNFDALLADEGLTDPAVLVPVDVFDEVPLYSRLTQIDFLANLPVVEQNRTLLRAALRHLDRVREHVRAHSQANTACVLRLVSVTGWWVDQENGGVCTDGTSEILVPNFWIGDLDHERMRGFRLYRPASRCATFVQQAAHGPRFGVFDSRIDETSMWCPRRVYIGIAEDIPSNLLVEAKQRPRPTPP